MLTQINESATGAAALDQGLDGFVSVRGVRRHPRYAEMRSEALSLWDQVLAGDRRASLTFAEAMTTSDFSAIFSDVLDRELLGNYLSITPRWQSVVRRGTVRDFRTANRKYLDGINKALGRNADEQLDELQPYPMVYPSDGQYTIALSKYGRGVALTWEDTINDDLDALERLPGDLATAARLGEEWAVWNLFFDASGPDATFFSTANANRVHSENAGSADNPPLSIAALEQAFTVLAAQRDNQGEPIELQMATLVVPPALEVTANNIINATTIDATATGGTSTERLRVANWMARRLQVVVVPYITDICTTANGATSWALFAAPQGNGRPAGEIAFLRSQQEPRLFIKAGNARPLGGGAADPMDGDFEHDAIAWKVRHNWGTAVMDPKQAVASNGSGS